MVLTSESLEYLAVCCVMETDSALTALRHARVPSDGISRTSLKNVLIPRAENPTTEVIARILEAGFLCLQAKSEHLKEQNQRLQQHLNAEPMERGFIFVKALCLSNRSRK